MRWYAIQSKNQKEQLLCEQLRLREIELFFPQICVEPVNPRTRKLRPYFPGYVFGYVDLEQVGRSLLKWIPGAVGIVNFGGEPAAVSDLLIANIRKHLEMTNASVGQLSRGFQPGDIVNVNWGPFAGYEVIFDASLPGRDRVRVLLKMLENKQIHVELPADQITLKKRITTLPVRML
jgi:transcriptional antiterminator RfaH